MATNTLKGWLRPVSARASECIQSPDWRQVAPAFAGTPGRPPGNPTGFADPGSCECFQGSGAGEVQPLRSPDKPATAVLPSPLHILHLRAFESLSKRLA